MIADAGRLVIAETLAQARDAAELIQVSYQPLDPSWDDAVPKPWPTASDDPPNRPTAI